MEDRQLGLKDTANDKELFRVGMIFHELVVAGDEYLTSQPVNLTTEVVIRIGRATKDGIAKCEHSKSKPWSLAMCLTILNNMENGKNTEVFHSDSRNLAVLFYADGTIVRYDKYQNMVSCDISLVDMKRELLLPYQE